MADESKDQGEGADAPQEDDLALTDPEDYGQDFAGEQFDEAEESFQQQQALGRGPAVAAAPGKMMIMIFGGGAIVLFLLYQLIFSESEAPPPEQNQNQQAASVAAPDTNIPTISQPSLIPPPLPEPEPQLVAPPTLPPLPTETSEAETLSGPEINFAAQRPTSEQMMQRRQSAMLIMGNGGAPTGQPQQQMSNGMPVTTQAARVQATQVGNLNHLILQGKVIKAVLETAIDSTLPGPLRAIVSRDVYAEAGSEVLIPKGSRLIGNYGTDLMNGQARVFIVWSRVIRPDGIDLNMEAPVMDRLGRAGVPGHVDSRFFEIFSGALLSSVFTIGTAYLGNEIAPGQVGTTQTPEGGVQVQGDPVSLATLGAAEQLALTAQGVLSNFFDMRPLVTIDQGTPVNVFVNQDLEFPQSITSQVRMIQ